MKEFNQINVTIETMDENSMFNTTKMIKQFYEAGIKIPSHIVSEINFLEYSTINLFIKYNNESFEQIVKEPLCLNLIKHLPFNYYKEYVDLNWIFASDNYNYQLIPEALAQGQVDFIKHIFYLFQEKKSLKLDDKQLNIAIKSYPKLFLDYLTNPSFYVKAYYHFSKNKERKPNFKELFDLGLNEYKKYLDSLNYDKSLNLKNWFSDANNIKYYINSSNTQEEYLDLMLTTPQAFSFFQDALSQYPTDQNPIINYNNAQIAFSSLNKNVFDILTNKLSLEQTDFNLFFQKTVKDFIKYDLKDFSQRNSQFKDTSYELFIQNLFSFSKDYISDFSFLDINDILYLLTLNNPSVFQSVIKHLPQIEKKEILNGLTIHELIYSHQILSQFINTYEYGKNKKTITYPNLELYLGFNLSKQFPELININLKISEKSISLAHEFLIPHLATMINQQLRLNIPEEELITQFRHLSLESSLNNNNSQKTQKFKV